MHATIDIRVYQFRYNTIFTPIANCSKSISLSPVHSISHGPSASKTPPHFKWNKYLLTTVNLISSPYLVIFITHHRETSHSLIASAIIIIILIHPSSGKSLLFSMHRWKNCNYLYASHMSNSSYKKKILPQQSYFIPKSQFLLSRIISICRLSYLKYWAITV